MVLIILWISAWHLIACECSSTPPTDTPAQVSSQEDYLIKGHIIHYEGVEIDGNTQHRITITKDGKTLFSNTSFHFSWLPHKMGDLGANKPELLDLAGNKSFEYLVLNTHSGGAHCCHEYYVLRLSEDFKYECIKHHGNSGVEFTSTLGQAYVGRAGDETFLYYKNFGYANSVRPDIILAFKEGCFVLDQQAMKHPISEEKFQEMLANIKKIADEQMQKEESQGGIDYLLLSWILDLIYTGNANYAWKAFDDFQAHYSLFLSGNTGQKIVDWAKEKSDLIEKIKQSPYYQDVLAINNGTIQ